MNKFEVAAQKKMRYALKSEFNLRFRDIFTTSPNTKRVVTSINTRWGDFNTTYIHTIKTKGVADPKVYTSYYSNSTDPFEEYLLCVSNNAGGTKSNHQLGLHVHSRKTIRPIVAGDVVWSLADAQHYVFVDDDVMINLETAEQHKIKDVAKTPLVFFPCLAVSSKN